ncbi:helix-turn-helix domain-containing protein [Robertmurraya korlensis]|uniref:helix-turn-helix domain-containing protein n=1 Tax=Robertmurraya korlensis TaxID=519977 RepID=UPI00203DD45B|nr:S24 family peptidase [Robertmurraya korlensis]MCM3599356.1 helix-turn-helix domain-containing protein [Robertmurraya korlensis]
MNEHQIKEVGLYLKKLRVERKISIRQLSEKSGVSHAYLSQIENGKRGVPSPDIIKKIAPHLNVSYKELMKAAGHINDDISEGSLELLDIENIEDVFEYAFNIFINSVTTNGEVDENYRIMLMPKGSEVYSVFTDEDLKKPSTWRLFFENLTFQEKLEFLLIIKDDIDLPVENDLYNVNELQPVVETAYVPILGYIAAGQPIMVQEQIVGYELMPGVYGDGYFLLEVKGDSMIGSRIFPGDKVLVKSQPEVENGEIAVVNVNGDDATLKKVKKYDDGSVWLVSTNEKYAPIALNKDSRIIGKVIRVIFEP